jgi:hypothetical protein
MLQPRIWEGISSQVPEDFDPYLQLLRAETLNMPEAFSVLFDTKAPGDQDLWVNVTKVLWYASQVKKSPTADLELVLILKKFDQEVDLIVRNAKLSKQAGNHWASIYVLSTGEHNSFLVLMARFCVLPYLRANMPNDPNRTPSKMCISLLENAVFGYEATEYHIEWGQRIATVAFLLGHGGPRQLILHGKSIIEILRLRKKVTDDAEKKVYFTKVEELLSPKRSWKESLKTRFERVKGR